MAVDLNADRGPEILGSVIFTTFIALIVVVTRFYVRISIIRNVGIDDYLSGLAMLLSFIAMCLVIPQVQNGAGRHSASLDPEMNKTGLLINFIVQPFYLWAIPLVKISVGFFLLRITTSKFYRRLIQCTMVFLFTYTIVCTITLYMQCENLAILWDYKVVTTCWPKSTNLGLSYANSTVNVTTDAFFALLPILLLRDLQVNNRTKATLVCILGLGLFACAAAIVKVVFLSNYGKEGDFLWDSANLTIWIAAECNVGLVAASLPCLKPVFKRVLDSSLRYGSSSKPPNYNLQSFEPKSAPKSKPRTLTSFSHGVFSNNQSEDSILGSSDKAGITKTTQVIVDREEIKSGSAGTSSPTWT